VDGSRGGFEILEKDGEKSISVHEIFDEIHAQRIAHGTQKAVKSSDATRVSATRKEHGLPGPGKAHLRSSLLRREDHQIGKTSEPRLFPFGSRSRPQAPREAYESPDVVRRATETAPGGPDTLADLLLPPSQ
jgi:hypothetical protein